MKKNMKNFLKVIYSLILLILITESVSANTIYSIDIEVNIDKSGNADITEIWNVDIDSGTELYKNLDLNDGKELLNFNVSDETGVVYDFQNTWNSSNSLVDKKNKNYILLENDEAELIWGVSNYGTKIYTINYTINNIVVQYSDYQVLYYNFLNIDYEVENSSLIIYSDYDINENSIKLWGFGYEGIAIIQDNSLLFTADNFFKNDDYIDVLVKFEESFFTLAVSSNLSFDDIYNIAFSKYNITIADKIFIFLIFIVLICIPVYFIGYKSIYIKKRGYSIFEKKNVEIIPLPKTVKNVARFSDNLNLERAIWISVKYNLNSIYSLESGIIGSYFIKFINDGKIKIESIIQKDNKNQHTAIKIYNVKSDNKIEKKLLKMLLDYCDKNGNIYIEDFEGWAKLNYYKLIKLNELIMKETEKDLIQKKLLTSNKGKVIINQMFFDEIVKFVGYKNYLNSNPSAFIEDYDMRARENMMYFQLFTKGNYFDNIENNNYNQKDYVFTNHVLVGKILKSYIKGVNSSEFSNSLSSFEQAKSGKGGRSFSSGGGFSGGSSGGGIR